jgi:hypothetical protein
MKRKYASFLLHGEIGWGKSCEENKLVFLDWKYEETKIETNMTIFER